MYHCRPLDKGWEIKMFLFLNQNICYGYSKDIFQLDDSLEHPKHILKLTSKKIFTFFYARKYMFFVYLELYHWTGWKSAVDTNFTAQKEPSVCFKDQII